MLRGGQSVDFIHSRIFRAANLRQRLHLGCGLSVSLGCGSGKEDGEGGGAA